MNKSIIAPLIILFSLSLISCGGGGGGGDSSNGGITFTGNTSQATVDADNVDELAVAATGGTSSAIASDAASTAPTARPSPVMSFLLENSSQLAKSVSTAKRIAAEPIPNVCNPGSADVTNNDDFTEFTIVYDLCHISYEGDTIIADGRLEFTEFNDGSFTFRYVDFSITYNGETYVVNQTIECDASLNCSFYSDYTGPDGRTYRVEGAAVSSPSVDSYSVSATVYDPDYGYITIVANVTYGGCTGGVPISGSITFTGSGGSSGSVTFNDCDSFTVDDGVNPPVIYFWADILA